MSRFTGTFAAGLTVVVVTAVAGCGSPPTSSSSAAGEPRAARAPSAVRVDSRPAASDTDALNTYRPVDLAFFGRLRLEGAIVLRPPASLKALSSRSSVTLAASVTDVRAAGSAGSTPVLEIVLKPERILHGALQRPGTAIRVATLGFGQGTGAEQAAALRSRLPKGQSVWFLRWQGALGRPTKPNAPAATTPTDPDLYALTHAFGVLVQGASHVEAPLTEADAPRIGFLKEAQGKRRVTDAVAATG